MEPNPVDLFLHEKVGYKVIEDLLKKKKPYHSLIRNSFEGTIFGSWESHPPLEKNFPKIPLIRKSREEISSRQQHSLYPFHLYLQTFFVGYTLDGIDGFFRTIRGRYFPHAQISEKENKILLDCLEIRISLELLETKSPKPCRINFCLDENLAEKYNEKLRIFRTWLQRE